MITVIILKKKHRADLRVLKTEESLALGLKWCEIAAKKRFLFLICVKKMRTMCVCVYVCMCVCVYVCMCV